MTSPHLFLRACALHIFSLQTITIANTPLVPSIKKNLSSDGLRWFMYPDVSFVLFSLFVLLYLRPPTVVAGGIIFYP